MKNASSTRLSTTAVRVAGEDWYEYSNIQHTASVIPIVQPYGQPSNGESFLNSYLVKHCK